MSLSLAATSMKQRLGHPATRAVAPGKRRDFSPALAACGGGHIPVPGRRSMGYVSYFGVAGQRDGQLARVNA